ncbi:hypothetical protein KIN20_028549 [Parelaphostrongylus tenuis]|uniref:7TM GPCR serpentine receptor class x (Srx) domain-containing protein n=1 Tax=Parelaphostrongylus tenuis TaxID=148309 RepID=A0AAD5R1F3_PARTN|nr:hypothetical protein KIN20_028549 [Parelaphostrongylus tenuis]
MLSECAERGGPTGLLLHAIGESGSVAGTPLESLDDQRDDSTLHRLAFQTLPISVLFVIDMAMFQLIPLVGVTGYTRFFVVVFENLIIIANDMSSPVMLLFFNRDVRKLVRNLFRNNGFYV